MPQKGKSPKVQVQGPGELQSMVVLSKPLVAELEGDTYADLQVFKITDPEEAGKRRRKSRSKLAKKVCKDEEKAAISGSKCGSPGRDHRGG